MDSIHTSVAPRNRGRKIAAVLAGGLVLGVGAAVTLAAWNDSEFASGAFQAGSFDLEGSTTSGTAGFTDHATTGSAAVVFNASEHGNVSPGDVLYEPFWVRLAAGTTSPAALTVAGVTAGTGGNEANFSYAIYRLAEVDAACDADGVADGTLIGSGASLSALTAGASSTLPVGDPTTDAGQALNLCFVVTAANSLVQGTGASATWELTAVSQ